MSVPTSTALMMKEYRVLVRCALQKEDQLVVCPGDWTVRRLKEHIAAVHPDQPAAERQKLIYMGACLPDGRSLSDCVHGRLAADAGAGGEPHCVFHLVYTPSQRQLAQRRADDEKRRVEERANVRRRVTAASRAQQERPAETTNVSPAQPQQTAAAAPAYTWQNTGGWSMEQQYAMQQQMYAAYMQQYMQFVQQAYTTNGNNAAASAAAVHWQQHWLGHAALPAPAQLQQPPVVDALQNAAVGVAPVAVAQQDQVQQPRLPVPNAPQPMMAAGGAAAAMVDEEEMLGPRDWIDYLYFSLRLALLLGLLLFYSSVERFIFVGLGALLLYAARRRHWFGLEANQPVGGAPAAPNNNGNQQVGQQAVAAGQQQPGAAGDQARAEGEADSGALGADVPASRPRAPEPSAWHVFWTTCYSFISGFFLSLVPDHPPPIDVN